MLAFTAMSRRPPVRSYWTWHRWLGLALLLPLVWWTGTALVFALRPIEEVRGRSWSTGRTADPTSLAAARLPAPDVLQGARALTVRVVEGHQVLVLERGKEREPEVFDQADVRLLGPAIPLPWALQVARRDFAGPFEAEAIYLYPRHGPGRRVAGAGPEESETPEEYGGPLPAYAFHLRGWPGMHLYVDALDGEVRARRTTLWRCYDLAFRLHALDFLPDGAKRSIMWLVVLGWLALGATGLKLAVTWLRRPAAAGPRSPNAP